MMEISKEDFMAVSMPVKFNDLLAREKKAFAFLATVKKDGSPQVTPVWFEWDGTHIVINTARGRVKDKIMHKHPAVAVAIPDPANPYRYLQIQGQVVAETEEGARAGIDDLSMKYHGVVYQNYRGETRVIYKILPVGVQGNG
jgi:PPOX class probable F420-dependent enzyme